MQSVAQEHREEALTLDQDSQLLGEESWELKGQCGCLAMSVSITNDFESQKAGPCLCSCVLSMRQYFEDQVLEWQNRCRLEFKREYLFYSKGREEGPKSE